MHSSRTGRPIVNIIWNVYVQFNAFGHSPISRQRSLTRDGMKIALESSSAIVYTLSHMIRNFCEPTSVSYHQHTSDTLLPVPKLHNSSAYSFIIDYFKNSSTARRRRRTLCVHQDGQIIVIALENAGQPGGFGAERNGQAQRKNCVPQLSSSAQVPLR